MSGNISDDGNDNGNVFRVIVLGVGNAFSAVHHPTSFLVETGSKLTLIDCPDRLARVLRDASAASGLGLRLADIDHVFLTHLHGDHVNGLEGFAFEKRLLENRRIHLHALPEVLADLWPRRLAAAMDTPKDFPPLPSSERYTFDDFFVAHPIDAGTPARIQNADVELRRTRHIVPTAGIKIRYAGRTVGFAADTAFEQAHVDWLADCDLAFHEVGRGNHTPWEALAAQPRALRQKLRILHMPDDYAPPDDRLTPAREGHVYDLLALDL